MRYRFQPPKEERTRFVYFLCVGGFAAGLNISVRWLLSLAVVYELSVALAYLAGMTTAFALTRRYVFSAKHGSIRGQYVRFAMVNAVAFAQVWLVSVSLARFVFPAIGFDWHAENVAHVLGVISPVAISYFGHKRFSFGSSALKR